MISAVSTLLTAVALFGFSVSGNFYMLCFLAIPYGLGAGAIDAALNNYVALHYESRHMSWLHCMWGVGASIGPYIMGYALSNKQEWSMGYRYISIFQIGLTAILIISLPLWKQFHKKEHVGQSAMFNKIRQHLYIKEISISNIRFFRSSTAQQIHGINSMLFCKNCRYFFPFYARAFCI